MDLDVAILACGNRMKIAIVGAGTVGTAVAVRWRDAGHTIVGITGGATTAAHAARWLPDAPVGALVGVVPAAELVAIAVPDRRIADVAGEIAALLAPGVTAMHFSGALGLEVLRSVTEAGGAALAIHPLQTFADVESALEALEGAAFAVTADDEDTASLGDRLAADLGGRPFRLANEDRPTYHAAAVFASNYLVATSGAALSLFEAAHVPDPLAAMRALQQATLANVHRLGPHDALTGPAVRGDAETIARNLDAIAATMPMLVAPYVALCRTTMDVAADRLDASGRALVEEVLERWS
jgi:predicted short-subunit dehydrogenase-like oxidoreductase (DUF2520 family)